MDLDWRSVCELLTLPGRNEVVLPVVDTFLSKDGRPQSWVCTSTDGRVFARRFYSSSPPMAEAQSAFETISRASAKEGAGVSFVLHYTSGLPQVRAFQFDEELFCT